jgi:hypothetical protein
VLENRWGIGTTGDVNDVAHDLLIVPASWEFGLFGLTNAVPVTAATARLAVEYVRGSLGTDADGLDTWAVLLVYRIPAGLIGLRVGNVGLLSRPVVTRLVVTRAVLSRLLAVRPVIGRAERLVVLLAGPRFGWLGPGRRDVTTRSVGPKVLFEPGLTRLEVVVRPV